MPEPWNEDWEVIKPLGSGGQGVTRLVKSRRDGSTAVLKTLNRPRDAERRARMHREAEALRTLSHAGIPRLLDSNTAEFAEETPLFIVVDFIDGSTLEKHVERGTFALEDAVAMTLRLVEIVAYCHDRSFGHRDIKPDNIIMRGDSKRDPVLIDFGLSFNIDDESLMRTGSEQQIGNRFLALPELTAPGSEKRDPRADLASCCGILYFALSGRQPMTLRDADNRAPHERRDFARVLDPLHERTRTLVNLLLGRGFMYTTDQRYQDASELKADLERVLMVPAYPDGGPERVRAAIERGQLRNREVAMSRMSREDALGEMLKTFVGPICAGVNEQVQARVAAGVPIRQVQVEPKEWPAMAGRVFLREKTKLFHYHCKATGTRGFAVFLQIEQSEYEAEGTLRFRLFTEAPGSSVREAYFLLAPGGRWTLIGRPPEKISGDEVVNIALLMIDDDRLWAVPEESEPLR